MSMSSIENGSDRARGRNTFLCSVLDSLSVGSWYSSRLRKRKVLPHEMETVAKTFRQVRENFAELREGANNEG